MKKQTAPIRCRQSAFLLCSYKSLRKTSRLGLALGDSSCRTLSCASAAVYTSVCIDLIVICSLRDSSYWTFSFASATAYALITNYMCHDIFLL